MSYTLIELHPLGVHWIGDFLFQKYTKQQIFKVAIKVQEVAKVKPQEREVCVHSIQRGWKKCKECERRKKLKNEF